MENNIEKEIEKMVIDNRENLLATENPVLSASIILAFINIFIINKGLFSEAQSFMIQNFMLIHEIKKKFKSEENNETRNI